MQTNFNMINEQAFIKLKNYLFSDCKTFSIMLSLYVINFEYTYIFSLFFNILLSISFWRKSYFSKDLLRHFWGHLKKYGVQYTRRYIAKIGTTDSELLSGNMRGEREENSLKKRAQVYIEMDGEHIEHSQGKIWLEKTSYNSKTDDLRTDVF